MEQPSLTMESIEKQEKEWPMDGPATQAGCSSVPHGPLSLLPRPLAFVLSGGAASGASQVGALLALRDAGVEPDLVVGTSVGAINGVMVAASPGDAAPYLAEVWTSLDREGLLGSSSLRCLPRLVRTRRHLFPSHGLRALIREHLPHEHFDHLPLPFCAVATNVATGSVALLREGLIEPALLASAAIPGIFPRVEIDGQWYLDGGVTANVPVRQALDLGARSVLVLDAASERGTPHLPGNIAETLQYVVALMMRHQVAAEPGADHAGTPVITLPRSSPMDVGAFDFGRSAELIELAYDTVTRWLELARGAGAPTFADAAGGADW